MSRSNPNANNLSPNPSTRWFEWRGSDGHFRWYDKDEEKNIVVKAPFRFILLDRTATVRGYNKKAKTGLYSNEVRDTRSERLSVKFFTGGKVAEGFWQDIKDTVTAKSGKFATNAYIAYKDGKELKIGCIQFSGCSLGPWFEFEKEHRKTLFEKAISVKTFTEEENGGIEFKAPVFELVEVDEKTNKEAIALDAQLQAYFSEYFKRNLNERPHPAEGSQASAPDDQQGDPSDPDPQDDPPVDDNDVPF